MKQITFRPRWREELEAITDDGKFIFELTMGQLHVYFPTRERWIAEVPPWAKDRWEEYQSACEAWCRRERIPFTLVDNALVFFEKRQQGEAR